MTTTNTSSFGSYEIAFKDLTLLEDFECRNELRERLKKSRLSLAKVAFEFWKAYPLGITVLDLYNPSPIADYYLDLEGFPGKVPVKYALPSTLTDSLSVIEGDSKEVADLQHHIECYLHREAFLVMVIHPSGRAVHAQLPYPEVYRKRIGLAELEQVAQHLESCA